MYRQKGRWFYYTLLNDHAKLMMKVIIQARDFFPRGAAAQRGLWPPHS